MRILKISFLSVTALIALFLLVAAILPKKYSIQRSVVINKPKIEVFEYVKMLKNQDNFSVWATRDPAMKKTFRGTDGTVGFVSAWESIDENVGKGEQEILKITDGERIDFELRFIEPFESTQAACMITEENKDGQTVITWKFDGKMNYPFNLMLYFMNMDNTVGTDLEIGLNNLKFLLEK